MKQEGKKYTIKESELKEIIREMILMEIYEPDKYVANFDNGVPPQNVRLRDLIHLNKFPEALNNAAQNGDNALIRRLNDFLGTNNGPAVGPDVIPGVGQVLNGTGPNANAEQVFYPKKAAQWLENNATPHYDPSRNKWCAKHVRFALNSGGLRAPWGMAATSAYMYANVLPANGWVEIPKNTAGQVGDIVVVDEYPAHPHGHIAMCTGPGRWVSDFVQRSVYGLKDVPPANRVHFYRYANIAGQNNQGRQQQGNENSLANTLSGYYEKAKDYATKKLQDWGAVPVKPGTRQLNGTPPFQQ